MSLCDLSCVWGIFADALAEAKLQAQLDHLRHDTDSHRSRRRGVSEEALSDARIRLRELQQAVSGVLWLSMRVCADHVTDRSNLFVWRWGSHEGVGISSRRERGSQPG